MSKLSYTLLFLLWLYLRNESRRRFVLPLPGPWIGWGSDLEIPRSPIFTLKSLVTNMFDGLISLWITPAECINLSAHKIWYTILITCLEVIWSNYWSINVLKSYSKYSMIMKMRVSFSALSWLMIRSMSSGTCALPPGMAASYFISLISLKIYTQW